MSRASGLAGGVSLPVTSSDAEPSARPRSSRSASMGSPPEASDENALSLPVSSDRSAEQLGLMKKSENSTLPLTRLTGPKTTTGASGSAWATAAGAGAVGAADAAVAGGGGAGGGGHGQAAQVQALPGQQFLTHLGFGLGGESGRTIGLEVFHHGITAQTQADSFVSLRQGHLAPVAHIGAQQFYRQLAGQVAVQCVQRQAGGVELALGGQRLQGQRALVVELARRGLAALAPCGRAGG